MGADVQLKALFNETLAWVAPHILALERLTGAVFDIYTRAHTASPAFLTRNYALSVRCSPGFCGV